MKNMLNLNELETPIAFVGMGVSGSSAYNLLKYFGYSESSLVRYDENKTDLDAHQWEDLVQNFAPKTLVVSPGYPLSSPGIRAFIQGGGTITSELSLGLSCLQGEKIIGVTGSLGKSTLVSLLAAGLASFTDQYFVGGNLGVPLCDYAKECEQRTRERAEWIVLELSSFQLENSRGLACDLSVYTYFTANHLERYADLHSYYETKWSMAQQTKDRVILNQYGGDLRTFVEHKKISAKMVWTGNEHNSFEQKVLQDACLLGSHSRGNLLLAGMVAEIAGWPKSYQDGMRKFPGLPHRIENIGCYRGITFIDDSKATNIASVLAAVESVKDTVAGRLFLLLGGRDKNLPWNALSVIELGKDNIHFVFFGESATLIQQRSGLHGEVFPALRNAVQSLVGKLVAGDLVLLSPGGSSYDEFVDFNRRGDAFKQLVKDLFAEA